VRSGGGGRAANTDDRATGCAGGDVWFAERDEHSWRGGEREGFAVQPGRYFRWRVRRESRDGILDELEQRSRGVAV
jgi:hypothetical protein